jgi:hypothetical protein
VARLSGLAGVAHVLVSIALGAVVIAVGLQFRSAIQSAQETIIGCILIATGLGFAILEFTGRGHRHAHGHSHDHDHTQGQGHGHGHGNGRGRHGNGDGPPQGHEHEHGHPRPTGRVQSLAAVMVPFGAAASPDLTILPVFLAATTAGAAAAVGSLVIFAAVTIGTIVGLTLAATRGGYEIRGQWLELWGNVLTALVLVVIGALVLAGII